MLDDSTDYNDSSRLLPRNSTPSQGWWDPRRWGPLRRISQAERTACSIILNVIEKVQVGLRSVLLYIAQLVQEGE